MSSVRYRTYGIDVRPLDTPRFRSSRRKKALPRQGFPNGRCGRSVRLVRTHRFVGTRHFDVDAAAGRTDGRCVRKRNAQAKQFTADSDDDFSEMCPITGAPAAKRPKAPASRSLTREPGLAPLIAYLRARRFVQKRT